MEYSILTSGRLSDQFYDFVKANYPAIKVLKAESREQVTALLPKVNGIAGFNFLGNQDVSHIQWIHSFGAGVDSFLEIPTLRKETTITRTTGDLGRKMGEFCLAHILAEIKKLFPLYENQKKALWKQVPTADLSNQTVLILGTGSIGTGVAHVLNGLVSKVIGLNQSNSKNEIFDEICDWESVNKIHKIDIVINALPATSKTSFIIDQDFFKNFQDIIFINIGRGNTVSEEDLILSLYKGHIRKAILDVFSTEPLPKESELWKHKGIVISPHQSGISTIDDVVSSFTQAYKALKNGEKNHLFVGIERGY